ncbi:MBL fold metallo-hydrolase [Paenibacillus sp. YN15]|uniref:MBL fold metallo-hydrolase n=1 Tax=Paenibacillus sp. YN15 TaxID=1742774 RepID=UPI000DCEEA06|nr:MBL fold metallo-hydrolase [Paenibacillus sp. YN15]RAV02658.1 MBL fold metallo-hydrolase [Paenibacillus sp. YN15]
MNRAQSALSRTPQVLMSEIKDTAPPEGCMALWFFGQESIVAKGRHTVICVDPFFSDHLEVLHGMKRTYPSLLRPEDVVYADLCLITHEHDDHLDIKTLPAIAAQCPQVRFLAPPCCRPILEKQCGIDPERIIDALTGQWMELEGREGERVRIQPVPAAHESLQNTGSEREHRFVGYLVEMNGVVLYHAGDTVIYPGLPDLLRRERVDVGMLPINGRDYFRNSQGIIGNMNIREAAELAAVAEMETVIPLHYDVFATNSEKPGYFLQELYERTPEQKCHVIFWGSLHLQIFKPCN